MSDTLVSSSFLAHASNIDDLLESLDGVFKDWLNRLHDTKSTLHVIDLRLHALNGFHLSGNFDQRLTIIKSLQNSSGKSLLDVFNGSGFSDSGITISSGLGAESGFEVALEGDKELIFVHVFVS